MMVAKWKSESVPATAGSRSRDTVSAFRLVLHRIAQISLASLAAYFEFLYICFRFSIFVLRLANGQAVVVGNKDGTIDLFLVRHNSNNSNSNSNADELPTFTWTHTVYEHTQAVVRLRWNRGWGR